MLLIVRVNETIEYPYHIDIEAACARNLPARIKMRIQTISKLIGVLKSYSKSIPTDCPLCNN